MAGSSYLSLVLLASLLTTSWTLEPGPSCPGQGRGWLPGARHRDLSIGRTWDCVAQKRMQQLASIFRFYSLIRVYGVLKKCGSVPEPEVCLLSSLSVFQVNSDQRGGSLASAWSLKPKIGYCGCLLGFIQSGCIQTCWANAPLGCLLLWQSGSILVHCPYCIYLWHIRVNAGLESEASFYLCCFTFRELGELLRTWKKWGRGPCPWAWFHGMPLIFKRFHLSLEFWEGKVKRANLGESQPELVIETQGNVLLCQLYAFAANNLSHIILWL